MRPFRDQRPFTEANGLICSWSEQHSFLFFFWSCNSNCTTETVFDPGVGGGPAQGNLPVK